MAGDTYLPRLLTSLACGTALTACLVGAGCDRSTAPAARTGERDRPSVAVSSASPGTQGQSHADPGSDVQASRDALARAAWERLRWPGGEVLVANRPERLEEPVHAGSIFKLVAARAAVAQDLVTRDTRFVCARHVDVRGRRVDCVHPDLGRPLTLGDALAHSCNHYFVRLAERLDRATLASTLSKLSAGAVTLTGDAPLPLVVLGLDGPTAGMRTWGRVALAAMAHDHGDTDTAALVSLGAARAVTEGTAGALSDATTLTLAKTGTTMPQGAAQEGRVVAWRPETGEAIVVRAPGVAGRDAARLARAAWDLASEDGQPRVRVGRVRESVVGVEPAVESVPLEAYVAGVVAAEGERAMPPVALQALAVLARSYARAPGRRHARDGYDVCDTTHCQVFGADTPWSHDATARTRGLVLTRHGTLVAVPYSASCSGTLSSPRDIWGGADEGLVRTGRDPAEHPVTAWQGEVEAVALQEALREAGYRGDVLRDVRVIARGADGVPARIALDGLAPAEIDATTFRHVVGRRIGWDVLKSHAWEVSRSGRGYRFTGRGKGHGAGLCVQGASALAARGSSLEQVIATYLPGATLRASQDQLTLRVPSALTSDAPRLRDAIVASLAELRVRLAVTAPRDLVIEVHPTREAYQRATGRAWWTSASTRHVAGHRYRVDLAPPVSVRAMTARTARVASTLGGGDLMTSLRHEAVHVLTMPLLGSGPAWAAEGLAHVASRAQQGGLPGSERGPCPTDEEVTRPGSLDAMRGAYARAAACVTAALPEGLATWRTLARP